MEAVVVAVVVAVEEEEVVRKVVEAGVEIAAAPKVVEWEVIVAILKVEEEVEKAVTHKMEVKEERIMNIKAKKKKCSVKTLMRTQSQKQRLLCSH